jgi:hypothetical protein
VITLRDVALVLCLLVLAVVCALAIHAFRANRARRKRMAEARDRAFDFSRDPLPRRKLDTHELFDLRERYMVPTFMPDVPVCTPDPTPELTPSFEPGGGEFGGAGASGDWDAPGDNGGGYSGDTGKVE